MGISIIPIANITGQPTALGIGSGKPQNAGPNLQASVYDQEVTDFIKAKEKELSEIKINNNLQPPEKSILLWIFSRDLGLPNPNSHLEHALKNWGTRNALPNTYNPITGKDQFSTWGKGNSGQRYWRAKLALMLLNELSNPNDLARLTDQSKPFKLNVTIPSGKTNDQIKLILLQSNDLINILKKTNDPLLWGDYYFQLGQVTQKTGGNGTAHFNRAIEEYKRVEDNTQNIYVNSVFNRVQDQKAAEDIYKSFDLPDALIGQAKAKLMLAATEGKDNPIALTHRREALDVINRAKQKILDNGGTDRQKLLNKQFQLMAIDGFRAEIAYQDQRLDDVISLTEANFKWGEAYLANQIRRENGSAWLKQIYGSCGYWRGKAYQDKASAPGLSRQERIDRLDSSAKMLEATLPYLEKGLFTNTQQIIGENYLLRAYATRSLGKDNWKVLLNKAEDSFKRLLSPAGPQDQAQAEIRATLAKILLIAGEYKPNALIEATQQIKLAINSNLLPKEKQSSAQETQGNIYIAQQKLPEAETALREAIRLDSNNYSATVLLGDVLNWRDESSAAAVEYQKVPADHQVYLHARLGLLEITAKLDPAKVLANDNVERIKELIGKALADGSDSGFLIPRGLELISEAFLADKSSQKQIIHLANLILGTKIKTTAPRGGLITYLESKDIKSAGLSGEFKAKLFLKLAQVLSWNSRFDEAEGLLQTLDPKKMVTAINLSYRLLRAELQMRKDRIVDKMMDPVLQKNIIASKDPDLFERLIVGRIEAYEISEKENAYKHIISFTRQHLEKQALKGTEDLFAGKGREASFLKFKFRLWQTLANALSRDKTYYAEAVNNFQALRQAVGNNKKEAIKLAPELAKLIEAQVLVGLGSIYTYDWDKKSIKTAQEKFNEALNLYPDKTHLSKQASIAMAEAHFMLGEIHRFGKDADQDFKDYPESKKAYEKAEKIIADNLSAGAKDYKRLFARLEYGLGELDALEGNLHQAFLHFQKANNYRKYLPLATQSQMGLSYNKLARRFTPSLSPQLKYFIGNDGRSEFQIKTELTVPFSFLDDLNWLQIDSQARIDVSPEDAQLYSVYLGGKIVTDFFSLGYKGRLGTAGGADSDFNKYRFISFPDHIADIYLGHGKYGSIQGSAGIDAGDLRRSTVYAAGKFNLAWTEVSFLEGLSFVGDYNHFAFRVADERDPTGSAQRMAARNQIGLGMEYNFSPLIGRHLTNRWELLANFKQLFNDPIMPPEDVVNTQDRSWQAGVEFGVTTGVYVSDWLKLDAGYTGQITSGYNMHTIGLGFSVVLPPETEAAE